MLRIFSRALTVLALCCAIGLQWLTLQSVAWAAMLAHNATQLSLGQAVAATFDGAHPCSLCRVVQSGSAKEKKSDLQPTTPKMDFFCACRSLAFFPPAIEFSYAEFGLTKISRTHSPPTPPPRSSLG